MCVFRNGKYVAIKITKNKFKVCKSVHRNKTVPGKVATTHTEDGHKQDT